MRFGGGESRNSVLNFQHFLFAISCGSGTSLVLCDVVFAMLSWDEEASGLNCTLIRKIINNLMKFISKNDKRRNRSCHRIEKNQSSFLFIRAQQSLAILHVFSCNWAISYNELAILNLTQAIRCFGFFFFFLLPHLASWAPKQLTTMSIGCETHIRVTFEWLKISMFVDMGRRRGDICQWTTTLWLLKSIN